jgi:hypothetical protein
VREASADLVRYATTAPMEGATQGGAAATDRPDRPADVSADRLVEEPASDTAAADPSSTLIIERRGRPEGVALGRGELDRLTSGIVMLFRGPRPALRAVAGTGPLVLSFEDEAERDRAAAELLDESGIGANPTATDPKEG